MSEKTCSKCGETKPLTDYHRNRKYSDGRQLECKVCKAAYMRDYVKRVGPRSDYQRQYRETNRERLEDHGRAYRRKNPERSWVGNYRLRAKRYGFTPVVEDFTKADVIERYGDACFYCESGDFEHLDHFVSVRDHGAHTLDNVRPACASCNFHKYAFSVATDNWGA